MNETFNSTYFQNRTHDKINRNKMYQLDINFIRKNVNDIAKYRILDVGCSDGSFINLLVENNDLYGLEINEDQAKNAALQLRAVFRNLDEVLNSKIYFDVLIFRGTLHHLTVAEITKLIDLKPKYIVILQAPNFESLVIRRLGYENCNFICPNPEVSKTVSPHGIAWIESNISRDKFKIEKLDYPYWRTPYRKTWSDFTKTLTNMIFANHLNRRYINAFPRNVFRLVLKAEV